ncbi:hypothetical protein W02_01210 [Nitrospira sp. KM1]|uniref:hypothetical protein n=1 Tax=Nitrospira sp. KM1 TaxID=1936990 RepID=UPI0013A79F46|nr:hypothetical protein [Nitrospira sp. KM1]BCA52981.1 hypothetical protein W02_01210 [Nitrospira sp. KM1]
MGPMKTVVRDQALYEAKSGKLIKDGFADYREVEAYVKHHYLALPVVDNAGKAWVLDDGPIYCLHGSQYELLNDQRVHLSRCPDCGGMGIRADEFVVESDCIRCTQCGHEFDARLEMMET